METFYLVDFENVNNEGIENIDVLSSEDHVYIFSTENAINIRMDIIFSKKIDIQGYIVPVCKQSLDMHLVSYLGYLLGVHGKQCSYVIISKDKDYDNIIKFWKENGYPNISREPGIQRTEAQKREKSKEKKKMEAAAVPSVSAQIVHEEIGVEMPYKLSGSDRSKLNVFMQHGLMNMGYPVNTANRICSIVISRCNEKSMLNAIYNDIKNEFDEDEYSKVYEDAKMVLRKFAAQRSKGTKRESKVRAFFGQHFKKKIYVDKKESIISILIHAKSKQQVNNELMKLYSDHSTVRHIYRTVRPLLEELPGK
ncbi:MAG: PIN domain-containing protein [Eubacteriales bacterium]|nr:PIN domain-containing protein [Eubacteriales bacterium]